MWRLPDTGPLAMYSGEPSGDAALLIGSLVIESGCACVTTDPALGGNTTRYLVAFPQEITTWDAKNQAVRLGDKALRVGSVVELGGGQGFYGPTGGWAAYPKGGCDESVIWYAGDR